MDGERDGEDDWGKMALDWTTLLGLAKQEGQGNFRHLSAALVCIGMTNDQKSYRGLLCPNQQFRPSTWITC